MAKSSPFRSASEIGVNLDLLAREIGIARRRIEKWISRGLFSIAPVEKGGARIWVKDDIARLLVFALVAKATRQLKMAAKVAEHGAFPRRAGPLYLVLHFDVDAGWSSTCSDRPPLNAPLVLVVDLFPIWQRADQIVDASRREDRPEAVDA